MIFAMHKVLKNSTCVTKISKKVGDSSHYAGDREKGLKILRLPPNAGELTAMLTQPNNGNYKNSKKQFMSQF